MQTTPPPLQTPRWLSRARLTAGAAGFAAAALSLAACGQGKVNTSIKRERAEVRRETGELPAAGTAKRLEREQSVFLRRHAKDPVDWYPWGDEAFAKARAEGRLVLVSIGYASCPWSQRMQDETFSDPVTARFMNRHFVNVLVDCGERTEVNNIYINFLFWKSRQSGWPLHLWLTPEGLPVFSGNYFPAKSTGNQASWNPIIEHIQNSYADDPAHVQGKALEVVREYAREYRKLWKSTGAPPAPEAQAACFDRLRSMFDPVHGGFTQAPKFALPYALEFLLNYTARLGEDRVGRKKEAENMLRVSLSNLTRGGIHDQLGGGFHRYSMDIYWAVPQFEKMLYDQGTLAGVLAEAAVTLNRPEYLETVRDVLGYTDRELGQPDGGFSGAQSSSSPAAGGSGELVEGSYYQWTWEEMEKVAGTAAMPLLRAVYDVDDQGNIPIDSPAYSRMRNVNVLRIVRPLEEAAESLNMDPGTARRTLDTARAALLEARTKRPQPLLDNAVITSWNGAAISGFARAGWVLNDPALTERAGKAADFVLGKLRQPDGVLVHAWLDAPSAAPAGSEDYAMMIRGLLDLYEATGTAKWLKEAAALQDKQNALLWDPQDGGFFDSARQPFLFNRMKSADESTEFAPAAISTVNQARLGWLLNRTEDLAKARTALNTFGSLATNAPATFLRLLLAADLVQRPPLQIVITGAADAPDRAALLAALRQRPSAGTVRLYLDGGESGKLLTTGQPSLEKLTSPAGRTTLHFCRNFELLHSITDPSQVKPWLEAQALASP